MPGLQALSSTASRTREELDDSQYFAQPLPFILAVGILAYSIPRKAQSNLTQGPVDPLFANGLRYRL
ncbi:hypothetical protein GYMLUDRAFT_920955 [Collybiopsis luxurians FD-317 M1]|uniref:Uncharacterized protein n=1 Tax=Collybiopsis luxurians FD-317 M1 TaxID=944289 RepID=A0A0D0ATZ4_9AGAR|nr:hypothetical protein GYMLUDRAFT_920955 [Collybiopsis luxurians FD-317 M1]